MSTIFARRAAFYVCLSSPFRPYTHTLVVIRMQRHLVDDVQVACVIKGLDMRGTQIHAHDFATSLGVPVCIARYEKERKKELRTKKNF